MTGLSAKYQIRMGLKIRCYTGFNKDGSKSKGGQGNNSESVDHQNQRHIRVKNTVNRKLTVNHIVQYILNYPLNNRGKFFLAAEDIECFIM